jgi:hypothetical protein
MDLRCGSWKSNLHWRGIKLVAAAVVSKWLGHTVAVIPKCVEIPISRQCQRMGFTTSNRDNATIFVHAVVGRKARDLQ